MHNAIFAYQMKASIKSYLPIVVTLTVSNNFKYMLISNTLHYIKCKYVFLQQIWINQLENCLFLNNIILTLISYKCCACFKPSALGNSIYLKTFLCQREVRLPYQSSLFKPWQFENRIFCRISHFNRSWNTAVDTIKSFCFWIK